MDKYQRKHFSMYIPESLLEEIKKIAKKRNITTSRYMLRLIVAVVRQENKFDRRDDGVNL